METLTRLNREQGVTIIVVTHEADIAAYADRIVTMRDGQIVSDERKPEAGHEPRIRRRRGEAWPAPSQRGAVGRDRAHRCRSGPSG